MTKSSTFVRSWIGFSNSFYQGIFRDCYISLEPEKIIHIVLEKSADVAHQDIYIQLRNNVYYMEEQEVQDKIIMNFQVPEDKEADLDHFVKGEYSQFSESAKSLILMSHSNMDNVKSLAAILYPEASHRQRLAEFLGEPLKENAEVYDKPDITKELFKINYITH